MNRSTRRTHMLRLSLLLAMIPLSAWGQRPHDAGHPAPGVIRPGPIFVRPIPPIPEPVPVVTSPHAAPVMPERPDPPRAPPRRPMPDPAPRR